MSFEQPEFEILPPELENEESEMIERNTESGGEKRASLLKRIIDRAIDVRDEVGERIVKIDPDMWDKIKQVPFARVVATAAEAAFGAEPGKHISSKDVLIRSAVAGLMGLEDVFKAKSEEGNNIDNVFKGKTFVALAYLKNKIFEGNPEDKKGKILEAISVFLDSNKDKVSETEDQINNFLNTYGTRN